MARRKQAAYGNGGNGATLGFEATLCAAADKLRNAAATFKVPTHV